MACFFPLSNTTIRNFFACLINHTLYVKLMNSIFSYDFLDQRIDSTYCIRLTIYRPCLVFFCKINILVFLFVFNKYYPNINQLNSKDSSRKLQVNYIINCYFYIYLILHTHTIRFHVTGNVKLFAKFFW